MSASLLSQAERNSEARQDGVPAALSESLLGRQSRRDAEAAGSDGGKMAATPLMMAERG